MPLLETITSVLFGSKDTARRRAAAAQKPGDLRTVVRVPQRMRSGYLWTEKLISPRACMIKDLSVKGARVEIIGDPVKHSLLADGVRLYFDTEKHEIQSKVVWSKGQMLGLRFEGKPRPPSRTYR